MSVDRSESNPPPSVGHLTKGNDSFLYITSTTAPGERPVLTSNTRGWGPSQCVVWNILSTFDETVRVTWGTSRKDAHLRNSAQLISGLQRSSSKQHLLTKSIGRGLWQITKH